MKAKLLLLLLFFSLITQAQTNLVPNGNFENWASSSQPDDWYRYSSGFASQSSSAQNGSSSTNMQIVDGTFNYINSEFFAAVANKTYRITMYHKLLSGTFSSLDFSVYHKPGTFKEEISKKTDVVFSTTEWRKIEFEYTPTVSENIEIDIWTTGTLNSEILIDNVSVVDIAEVPVQYTLIPDSKFEAKLIALGHDDVADGKVLTSKINIIKSLDVSKSLITDLTGIQDFAALNYLYCYNNKLLSLDVSKNTALVYIQCGENQLTELDVTKNTALSYLACHINKISSLDLSKNSALKNLSCNSNILTNLNLKNGKNTLLTSIDLRDNPSLSCITVDDVAYSNTNWDNVKNYDAFFTTYDCTAVTQIPDTAFEDKLIDLGIDTDGKNGIVFNSSITSITSLDVSNSSIPDLTGIYGFTALTTLNASNNLLKTLDLSKNSSLTTLNCSNNATLTCIQVADVAHATNNWTTSKDAIANFNLDCRPYTLIPDVNFEKELITLGIDSGTPDGKVLTNKIKTVTDLRVSTSSIEDLTGIEDFTALISLDCSVFGSWSSSGGGTGKLTKLDVTKNKLLRNLTCSGNQLTSLNVSENKLLLNLNFSSNLITEIDLSNNTDLKDLNCYYNRLANLYVSKNPLGYLNCSSNKLTSLDLSNNSNIYSLDCSDNQINSLDVSNLSLLKNLDVKKNKIDKLNIEDKTKLVSLNCSLNLITSLDVSQLTALEELKCDNNKLTSLDVTHNTKLKFLNCGLNTIPSFDITKNPDLIELECSSLQLNQLDVTKHTALKKLTASKNNLTSIDVSNNLKLTDLYLGENQLTDIDITKNVLLSTISVGDNKLSVLNLVNNTVLEYIVCHNNFLTSLDISNNKKVVYVLCSNNKLTNLNLKNGFKGLYVNLEFPNYINNPDLKCIQVTDATYAKERWSQFADPNVRFSEDCSASLELPSTNFTVQTKGESCLGENNGEINISATQTFAYTASIGSENYPFANNKLAVTNLTPGNYTVIISIPGENFGQTFNLTIPKGATITGKSSVSSKKVNIEITDGTAPYTVFVNGIEQFETSASNFSLTAKGGGLLEVKTAKACEGIYTEDITGLDLVVSAYPNPTSGSFEIELPVSDKEVTIEINALDGRVISSKKYSLENGTAQLTLENQPKGVYIAKIHLGTVKNVKIIKN